MRTATFNFEKPTNKLTIRPESWQRRVIEFTYHGRLATKKQLKQISGLKDDSHFNQALRRLCQHRYLDRPPIGKTLYAYDEERPLLHALGDAGARYCSTALSLPVPSTVQWTRKNRELKDPSKIAHTLGVSEIKKCFQIRLQDRPGYRLQQTAEVVATSANATMPDGQRVSFATRFSWPLDGEVYPRATWPDWLFRIERLLDRKTLLLMLEWDEDTEQYTTKNPMSKASILQKDLGYADIVRRGLAKQQFGNAGFQRLFVTTGTDNRVDACINLFQEHTARFLPGKLFLYTTAERFLSSDFLYEPIWLDGNREQRQLLVGE